VTSEPHAFATVDLGAATVSVSLIGKLGRAWRLVGTCALPSASGPDVAIDLLLERIRRADPTLLASLGLDGPDAGQLVRLEVRSNPARTLAVVAATERSLAPLVAAAARSGWQTVSASAQTTDPLAMSRMLFHGGTHAILAGATDPPAADERSALGELAALVSAVATRRPDRLVVLAGGMAERLAEFGDPAARAGEIVLAPAAGIGPAGAPLHDLLLELAGPSDDARRTLGIAAATLAEVADRRVELVEIGYDGATRALARPATAAEPAALDLAVVPGAGLAPAEPDDEVVDRVLAWSTIPSDRHRVRDRLRELRIAPWSDATGDGLDFRVAVAHASLARLVEATGEPGAVRAPDLIVACGGVWAAMPPALVALTLADVLRRPGASQLVLDHAGVLAPLGAIPDAAERRAVLADLVDDLLAPLGTLVMPSGLRSGRVAGQLIVHGGDPDETTELAAGELAMVRLAPGQAAVAEFRFRDSVRLGGRGRQFAIDVAGGLSGVLVDLRDVPLRLPDRADGRREQLRAWQAAVLPGRVA
jgi:hypothetical protein